MRFEIKNNTLYQAGNKTSIKADDIFVYINLQYVGLVKMIITSKDFEIEETEDHKDINLYLRTDDRFRKNK